MTDPTKPTNPIEPATPLPWKYDQGALLGSDGTNMASSKSSPHKGVPRPKADRDADGLYIEHACNEHPKLVEQVRVMREALEMVLPFLPLEDSAPRKTPVAHCQAADAVRSALTEAGEA